MTGAAHVRPSGDDADRHLPVMTTPVATGLAWLGVPARADRAGGKNARPSVVANRDDVTVDHAQDPLAVTGDPINLREDRRKGACDFRLRVDEHRLQLCVRQELGGDDGASIT